MLREPPCPEHPTPAHIAAWEAYAAQELAARGITAERARDWCRDGGIPAEWAYGPLAYAFTEMSLLF